MKKFFAICLILPILGSPAESEYTPKYCLQLEAAYGTGMMSEGGVEGIEHMFDQIPLAGKTALDIGSGLGGVAFYLAENYAMDILGLDVNRWMVAESNQRTPMTLNDKVHFMLSESNRDWQVPSEHCDLIYSKGVLTHLESKHEIFQECHRILKNEGLLVITDWLSSDEKKWGPNIAQLVELEGLVLFPESIAGYIEQLEQNGFTLLSVRDDSATYQGYNEQIIERLQNRVADCFEEGELESSIIGYEAIVRAFREGELKAIRFVGRK